MSEFDDLYSFAAEESYGEGGTPVSQESVETMESAVSYHMMDTPMDNSAGNLEQLGAEMTPEPPTPVAPPAEAMPLPPSDVPSEPENASDNLESFMASHSEDFRDVASMNLADYEQWLFQTETEAGEVAVARIVSNFKASGFDVKPSYAAVAGATWSRMNYEGENHMESLRRVERAPVSELQPLVVEVESEGLTALVDTLRRAESFTDDYRAEIISEIREQMRAEQESLEAENENARFAAMSRVKEHTTPIAVVGATLLGLFAMRVFK